MKNKNKLYSKFVEFFTKEVTAKRIYEGDDRFIDALVNPKEGEKTRKVDPIRIGSGLIAGAVLAGGIAIASRNIKPTTNDPETESYSFSESAPITPPSSEIVNPNVYHDTYRGQTYLFAREEYVLELARESLTRVENLLMTVDGMTPVGTSSGDFYPEYYNEYLLTALCFTESSYRISDENGNLLKSSAGALGLTQVRPSAIEDLNDWLNNTLGLKNIKYTTEDLNDLNKAMDISNMILIKTCKSHGKVSSKSPIYPYLNESFSLSRQEEILLAIYNNGYSNMLSYIQNGTVYDYLSEGNPSNYVNKVLSKKDQLMEKYGQIESE